MIRVEETKQYHVRAQSYVSDAFEQAYSRYADTQVAAPPDTVSMVFSIVSMLLVIAMLALTVYFYPDEKLIWLAIIAVFVFLTGRIIFKHIKARKAYLDAAGKPSTISLKKNNFFALFGGIDAIPEVTTAADLQNRVRPLLGKQKDAIYNTALRSVSEDLVRINCPELPTCKLITPLAETFTQVRQRFFFKEESGSLIFFDCDWMNPKGQIVCDVNDIVSFGRYSQYTASINSAGGGKIRPDAVILEIQDESQHVYFEFPQQEYDTIRKRLPGKKEKK